MNLLRTFLQSGVCRRLPLLASVVPIALAAAFCAAPRSIRAATREGSLTYGADIEPLIAKNCVPCHRVGEAAPFALDSYATVSKHAEQIAEVVSRRIMPPWKLDSHGEFENERRLSDDEISLIKRWVDEGSKEGRLPKKSAVEPFKPGSWMLGKPDFTFKPNGKFKVPAEGRDVYRNFVVSTDFDEDRYVSAVDVHPGNRAVVHHVLVYLDMGGRAKKLDGKENDPGYTAGGGIGFEPDGMLGGWAPGAMPIRYPVETGILLPKGADIVVQVHYHKDGKAETDCSEIGLYFNKVPVQAPMHIFPLAFYGIRIPAGNKDHVERAHLTVPMDASVYTVFPHMHCLGRTMKVVATLPDGTKKTLVNVTDWDFNWQGFYAYKTPVKLPKGTSVDMEAHYDNSEGNFKNPNHPPRTTYWGEQTTDEMCLCYLGFTLAFEQAKPKEVLIPEPPPLQTPPSRCTSALPLQVPKGKKGLVLFFLGSDCPISHEYAPEIRRICAKYPGMAFDIVYPEAGLTAAQASKASRDYGYPCPFVLDASHRWTNQVGATITPEVAVVAASGKVVYRGRIDNKYAELGKPRYEVTQHDLRDALDSLVAGRISESRFTKATGCVIENLHSKG